MRKILTRNNVAKFCAMNYKQFSRYSIIFLYLLFLFLQQFVAFSIGLSPILSRIDAIKGNILPVRFVCRLIDHYTIHLVVNFIRNFTG